MKVLVVSDSHGNVENICRAVELEQPRMLLHLGDGWRDAELVAQRFPELPLEKVPGNCDFRHQDAAVRLTGAEMQALRNELGDVSAMLAEALGSAATASNDNAVSVNATA